MLHERVYACKRRSFKRRTFISEAEADIRLRESNKGLTALRERTGRTFAISKTRLYVDLGETQLWEREDTHTHTQS